MAAESSSARSSSAADSYIGSLISLTSKSEIRYEGVLYNINTDESSIGLRNVRSFGTEGRKKDGPQVPPSDKVYDYILFRGSDIKDLQVKSSPPPSQPAAPINNDPAIIQSHYSHPYPTSTALPSVPTTDVGSHTAQLGQQALNFQAGLPLYQPGANIGPWGASPLPPPTANPGGLTMPMYWQGYYGAPNGIPQMHQQPPLRPSPGLSVPPYQQPVQHPSFNASLLTGAPNLPEASGNLFTMGGSSLLPVSSTTLPSTTLPTAVLPTVPSEMLSSSLPISKAPITAHASTAGATPTIGSAKENTPMLSLEPKSAIPVGTLYSDLVENLAPTPTPLLVTPDQLLQPGPTDILLSQSSQVAQKDVEVVPVSSPPPEPSATVAGEAQPPILPLPAPARTGYKHNGAQFQNHYGRRGRERGRGRGSWSSRPVTTYSEDFDFTAMNEKFNKDEVWGHLSKNSRNHLGDEADANLIDEEEFHDEDETGASKIDVQPVYNKDDFFDSLSCDAFDRNLRGGRTRFSEQRRMDSETFGEFSRYRGGRGGRGPGYGGNFRSRGFYNGRGYGYNRRGRGRDMYTSAS